MRWSPAAYARYGTERSQPFFDLISRIGAENPRTVVDLGCGPGTLTIALAERWPDAEVIGIDSSAEMIEAAARLEDAPANLRFVSGDLNDWMPTAQTDVVVSNAALQWVPGHESRLRRWYETLPAGAWLAFQVPGNFGSPSHTLMRELAESERWRDRLHGVLRHEHAVAEPEEYLGLALDAGWSAQAWETTYLHLLPGEDPVLEWVRGTGLRPILATLTPAETREFETTYAALLREAYPTGPHGTVYPFRRLFCVAHNGGNGTR